MAHADKSKTHPLLVERNPRNHNAAIIAIVILVSLLLLGALAFRGITSKSASADVNPLSPVPALDE